MALTSVVTIESPNQTLTPQRNQINPYAFSKVQLEGLHGQNVETSVINALAEGK